MKRIIGIYKVTSPTNKIYIGQSVKILHRFNSYKKYRCKSQPRLYNSLIKYGSENHKFEIIKECSIDELNKYEIHYIEVFQSFNTFHGLNLQAGGHNGTPSNETKQKLRDINLGKKYSSEINYKKGSANRGKKLSEETLSKMRGQKRTKETRKNISESLKGKKKSPQHNINNRKARLGTKLSDETKNKMSKSHKGKIFSSERKENMRIASLNRKDRRSSNQLRLF